MAFVHNYSDGVNKPKFASVADKRILEGRAYAAEAVKSKIAQFVRAELCRMTEAAKAYKDQKYIARCESIKQNLSCSDKSFEAQCKTIIDSLIVDAALQCRIEKGTADHISMTKYLKPAFERLYGKMR